MGMRAIAAALILSLALPAAAGTIAAFPEKAESIYDWMGRSGWESKRHDPGRWEVGQGRLRMVSRDDSVLIGTERGLPADPRTTPKLRFRVKVLQAPRGTDLSRKSGDDAAFRVYVGFDRGGGLFSPPNTIAYTWTGSLEPGSIIRSGHSKRLRYLSIGKGSSSAGWLDIERDLVEDYKKVFPEDDRGIPNVKAILLKCDTNNVKGSAEAWVSDITLGD